VTLAEVAIRRPVLAIVLSIVLVLFGVVGFGLLGVREYPAVDPPIVTVTTSYAGANPDVVSAQITEPLEQALSGVAGIRTISSTSSEGSSSIRVEFALSVDLETAANDVRDKVSAAVRRLPADADPPVVEKSDADSDPIVFMTVSSQERSILEVSNIADTLIKERVQTIPGVSTVRIFGEQRYAMRVWLDAEKMARERVTPADVQRAIGAQNVDLPSGRIEGQSVELTVRTSGRLTTPEEFDRLTVRTEGDRAIQLRDVGHAELGTLNDRVGLRERGRQMIGVAIIPQPNTNAIAIADEFYRRLEEIKVQLPPEYQVEIGYDFTKYVRRSVEEVEETLLIAFGLVVVIIFAFLRDWRSTVIPVLAIPVSIIATFFLLWLLDFSINVLTLVAIVLSIGLVCDDAIVVLENIYSKIEDGMRPLEAAIRGSKEIYFAIISTTITLAVVFLPIVFLEGLTGRLFREFAAVVVGSVLISGFVALTLSPMMCRYLLQHQEKPNWLYRKTEPFFRGLTRGYEVSLRAFMRVRVLTFPLLAAIVVGAYFTYGELPSELAPLEDRSNIRISVRGPEGATFAYTQHQLEQVSALVVDEVPEVWRTFSIIGAGGTSGAVNAGIQNVYLVDGQDRTRTQEQIYEALSKKTSQLTGVRASPAQPPTIGAAAAGNRCSSCCRRPR
jgi:multidrug efflux pump